MFIVHQEIALDLRVVQLVKVEDVVESQNALIVAVEEEIPRRDFSHVLETVLRSVKQNADSNASFLVALGAQSDANRLQHVSGHFEPRRLIDGEAAFDPDALGEDVGHPLVLLVLLVVLVVVLGGEAQTAAVIRRQIPQMGDAERGAKTLRRVKSRREKRLRRVAMRQEALMKCRGLPYFGHDQRFVTFRDVREKESRQLRRRHHRKANSTHEEDDESVVMNRDVFFALLEHHQALRFQPRVDFFEEREFVLDDEVVAAQKRDQQVRLEVLEVDVFADGDKIRGDEISAQIRDFVMSGGDGEAEPRNGLKNAG